MTVEANNSTAGTSERSDMFRDTESPEKHLNGVVYRRTGLDDGPRYLPESNAGPRYLPTRGPLGPMVTNGVSYDGI